MVPQSTELTAQTARDASDPASLPPLTPMSMPEQDFSAEPTVQRKGPAVQVLGMRVALFGGAALSTFAFAYELHRASSVIGMTPLQIVFLVLSTMAFGWIALGSLSAALGFVSLAAAIAPTSIQLPDVNGPLTARTALLFPVYHEDPARIAGTIEATVDDLAAHGKAHAFDVYVLSDTRGDEAATASSVSIAIWPRGCRASCRDHRRRRNNTARKAGNIKDWVERFGAACIRTSSFSTAIA